MSIALEEGETRSVIRLEGDIDITCSDELMRTLVEAISSQKELRVDLAGVTDLDVTAMQLFWAAAHEAEKRGISLAVTGQIPEAIRCAVREAGFENFPIAVIAQNGQPHSPVSPAESADDR